MNYIPVWVFCIPDKESPDYYSYLMNDAIKDGVPEHVRINLISQYLQRTVTLTEEDLKS